MTLSLRRLDWILLRLAVLALVALSALLVWSATSHRVDLTDGDSTAYLRKQLVNIVIGLVLLVGVTVADHRWVRIVAPIVYLLSVSGLVLVLTMGSTINGSRSWLRVLGLSIQPSEFAKLAVVIGMALVLAERSEGRWRRRVGSVDVLLMLVIAGVPAVLILLQPDLGTMLVLSATVFGVLAVSGRSAPLAGRRAAVGRFGRRARPRRWRAEGLPGRPFPGLREPRPRPPRRRLQRRAGPDRDRQRRAVRAGPVPRLPDALRLRARAADRLRLHGRRGGARPRGRRAR